MDMVAVTVSSRFRTKATAGADQKHHGSGYFLPNMAVSSMEYNHKMDGKSGATNVNVSMASDADGESTESGGVPSSGTGSGSVKMGPTSQSSGEGSQPQPQDARHGATNKRKASDSLFLDVSTPVAPTASQMIHANSQKPKKGSFQITRVINRKQLEMDTVDHAEDADSIGDDFDETNTEDLSSEIMDTSKMTDIDQDPSSEDTVQSLVVEDLKHEGKHLTASLPQTKEETPQYSKSSGADVPRTLSNIKDENTDPNFGENRFRIVKVSNERFLRGRWTCVDYQDSERTQREKSNEDLGSGNSSAASSVHYVPGVDDPSKNPLASLVPGEATPSIPETQSVNQSQLQNGDYTAQSMASNPAVSVEKTGAHELSSSIVQPSQQASQSLPSQQHSQQPPVTYAAPTSTTSGVTTSTSTTKLQDYPGSSHQDFLGQTQQATQPTTQTIPQQQQQQQQQKQTAPNQTTSQKTAPGPEFNNGGQGSKNQAESSLGDVAASSVQPTTGKANVTDFNPNSGQSNNASPSDGNVQGSEFQSTAPTDGMYIVPDDQQSTVSVEESERNLSQQLHVRDDVPMMKPLMMQVGLTQPLLEMVQTMHYPQKDTEDESGASTVAIDHKIEQAMDLVKSHLMFAVHEEVMVLKEQIKELLEKNSQLEIENNILRSSATPETLAKLSQATPAASSQSSSS